MTQTEGIPEALAGIIGMDADEARAAIAAVRDVLTLRAWQIHADGDIREAIAGQIALLGDGAERDERGDIVLERGDEEVEVVLTPEEAIATWRRIHTSAIPQAEAEIEVAAARLRRLKGELALLVRQRDQAIEDSTEIRLVPTCTVLRRGQAVTYRTDTGEVVDSREATTEELQQQLDLPEMARPADDTEPVFG